METPQANYYAIIPANVRYSRDLEPNAKLLYGELTALAHAQGYCWASNEYFAKLYDVDISTIKRWIASLAKHKFIYIKTVKSGVKWDRRIFISPEVFKNYLRRLKNEPDTGDSNKVYEGSKMSPSKAQKRAHNNTSSSDEEDKLLPEAAPPEPPAPSASPRATELFDYFFQMRSKYLPDADTKKKPADAEIFDKLLEKHTEEQIKAVIVFAFTDASFWRGKIINPKQLILDKNKQPTRFVLLKEQMIQTGKRHGTHSQAASPETEDGKPRFKFKRVIRG